MVRANPWFPTNAKVYKPALPKPKPVEHDYQPAQDAALDALREHGPQRKSDLARLMGVGKSGLSKTLPALRDKGLVTTCGSGVDTVWLAFDEAA